MAAFSRRGLTVAAAKVGPDYIDPRFHEAATGGVSATLDGWAMRPETRRGLIDNLAGDLVVAEGVMGLFDGAPSDGQIDDGSTAALARATSWPVVLVVDAARQAGSIAALVHGFTTFDPALPIAGVILNRVGGDRHVEGLRAALAPRGVAVFGAVPRTDAIERPSRHLGLVQAREDPALSAYLDRLVVLAEARLDLDALLAAARPAFHVAASASVSIPPLGNRIAIARDDAFGFLYPHLLDGWQRQGAALTFFSPLANEAPDAQADEIFLPGGYPELHGERLAAAKNFHAGLAAAAERGAFQRHERARALPRQFEQAQRGERCGVGGLGFDGPQRLRERRLAPSTRIVGRRQRAPQEHGVALL